MTSCQCHTCEMLRKRWRGPPRRETEVCSVCLSTVIPCGEARTFASRQCAHIMYRKQSSRDSAHSRFSVISYFIPNLHHDIVSQSLRCSHQIPHTRHTPSKENPGGMGSSRNWFASKVDARQCHASPRSGMQSWNTGNVSCINYHYDFKNENYHSSSVLKNKFSSYASGIVSWCRDKIV